MSTYSRKKIIDEFTDKDVSRERKRQLRKVRAGLCLKASCNEPIFKTERCKRHHDEMLAYLNKRNALRRELALSEASK
jgi:hypothetical protein